MEHSDRPSSKRDKLRDVVSLTKPGIVRMCLLTTAGAMALADAYMSAWTWFCALLGSSAVVASANMYNMVWERDSDRLMERTRNRPVAARRMTPKTVLILATLLAILGLGLLASGTNTLTVILAALALFSYVLIYTPLKFVTPLALFIGAFPGAVPPLLGWTAATNRLDLTGLLLFTILLIWQIPHSLAISMFRKKDYQAAGIRVVPVVRGDHVAKVQAILWCLLLIPVSMALTPLGLTGNLYFVVSGVLGLWFLWVAVAGLRAPDVESWARRFFFVSLFYLPALTLALVLDKWILDL